MNNTVDEICEDSFEEETEETLKSLVIMNYEIILGDQFRLHLRISS